MFVVAFSLLFILFFSSLSYTLPFVLAFIIALWTKPLNKYLQKKFKISNAISSIISTTLVFSLLGILISAVLYKITNEARLLLTKIPNLETIRSYVELYLNELNSFFGQLDPALIEKAYPQLTAMLSGTFDVTVGILNTIISFVIGLPVALMIAFITFLATYFFSKDMPDIVERFYSIFSFHGKEKMHSILKEGSSMIAGYFKAYSTVIFLTFLETLIGLSILGIDYALILSILSAIMDVLPILGISAVYIPLALYNLYLGNTFVAVGLLILYVIVTVARQIIEPKLVSTTLDIHPVMILAAIFIGLKAYGFLGMIFLIALMVVYKILSKVRIL
ncbi:sporulation integral membrane protein YtvI [Anaerosolibacter carboniphilus]|uniref:sporulation integral membrane protein YtvI n=1 Tax=Anaerosolibacter carboniphilus TaxID=1417629 RepID=UPI002ED66366